MNSFQLLAQVPAPGVYLNLFKIGIVAALFVAWAYAFQWVDRDIEVVKTRRERWNVIVLGTGIGGLVVLMVFPWAGNAFFLGLGFWLLLAGGGELAYVIHRNGRVVPDQRILSLRHIQRLIARDPSAKGSKLDRGQRIHLTDADGAEVARPTDRLEYEQYCAAQDFLFDVLWRRASNVDLLVGKEKTRLVYRIDGVVSERNDVVPTIQAGENVVLYLKQLAGLNPEEIRRPQEGAIFASLLGDAGDLGAISVITSGSTLGERLRLKVQKSAGRLPLDDLGLAKSRLGQVRTLIDKPRGMVLISGPKGSGVTTTQYAVMRTHDAFMHNLHALERKPLYELDNITQAVHDGSEEKISYARKLQSVLRREPDVVAVGECEDRETAQIALRAAAQERKIYMALEAKSTLDALSRLMGLADDAKLVSRGLLGVLNQRLVRVLCTACRQSFKPDESLLKKANLPVDKIEHFHRPPTEPVYDRKGRQIVCQTCQGSGYVGRVGVFEVMVVNDAIRQLITASAPIKQIKAQARKNRMYYLQEEGLLKVIDGMTSLDEVIRGVREESK